MLNANHPDDERLSALAFRDADVMEDTALAEHVAACDRCGATVADLGALRATLANLPDLQPHRPLRLIPPVEREPEPVGAAGWIRRLFAPALTMGVALTLVGGLGTAAPLVDDMTAQIFQNVGTEMRDGGADPADGEGAPATEQAEALSSGDAAPAAGNDSGNGVDNGGMSTSGDQDETATRDLPAERSIWPMVLFTGVALMIAVGLLRWILVPRAG